MFYYVILTQKDKILKEKSLHFIDYNDPLFSVIVILVMILATAMLTHFLGKYKVYREQKTLNNLIKKYDFIANDDAMISIIKESLLPHETIFFIASSYEKSGDYERAINIYTQLLISISNKSKQVPILFRLGVVYYKSGFMQRSLDVFLRLLRIDYSHIQALEYLALIYEKLKDYKEAKLIVQPLKELQVSTDLLEAYLDIKILTTEFSSEYDKMVNISLTNKRLSRVVIEYFLKIDISLVWRYIDKLDFKNAIDLFLYIDKSKIDLEQVKKSDTLMQLFSARGMINGVEHSHFELEQLALNHTYGINISDLGFEYICQSCKKVSPIYSNRCHSCNSLLNFDVIPVIIKKVDFTQVKGFYEGN
jgi:tetratricopeptide (TPR) repeat protein